MNVRSPQATESDWKVDFWTVCLNTMEDLDVKSKINDTLSHSKSTPVIQRRIGALERTPAIKVSRDILRNTKEILYTYRLSVEMHHNVIEGGDDLVNALEKEFGKEVRIKAFSI